MKKLLVILALLISTSALAQPVAIRNDAAATTLSPANGASSALAVDAQGKLFTNSAPASATTAAQYSTLATVGFAAITAGYTTFLTNVNPLKQLDILNTTNCSITISFNASVDRYVVPAYSSLVLNYQELAVKESGNVSGKSAGSCTVGSVYVSGIY